MKEEKYGLDPFGDICDHLNNDLISSVHLAMRVTELFFARAESAGIDLIYDLSLAIYVYS